MIGRQVINHLQTKAHGVNDVAKADVAHIEQAAQIGQHHHHRTRRQRTVGNRLRQVEGRIAHLDRAPVEQVRHVQGQLQVLIQRHARTAGADAQALEAGRGTARQVDTDAAQGFARQQLGDFKTGATGLVGRAIQRQRGLGLKPDTRARALATGLQAQKAQLRGHGQVGHCKLDAGTGRQLVDGQRERLAAQVQDQVKAGIDVDTHDAGGRGAQGHGAVLTQIQVDRRLQIEQCTRKPHRYAQIADGRVVGDLLVAQQARFIDGLDELVYRLDLLDLLVHGVAHRAQVLGKVVRQAQALAIGRHIDDLRDQAAFVTVGIDALDRDPVAGHGGRKLARRTGQRGRVFKHGKARALIRCNTAAGQGALARAARPDLHRAVKADAVDHLRLEHRGHIEQLTHRLLDKGQARQTELVDIDGLQVAQHIGQGRDQIGHTDLAEIGQLIEVLGVHIELALKGLGRDAD